MDLQYRGTLISSLSFFIAPIGVSASLNFFSESLYYTLGLLMYLPIFLIPSLLYERRRDARILYIMIALLWITSFIFTAAYLSIQGLGGTASGAPGEDLQLSISSGARGFIMVSFPYLAYTSTFLAVYSKWRELAVELGGYTLIFLFFSLI